ncbi:HAMP domain-containing sensor histidine kinase [Clostridium sp. JS66]|uniref:HAMP domain-containing sensor histidine kinase n=1 Tax=Clostridium sp. JS66 TaxID=3064705 RepID=UPI00298E1682|nr:HAMP domain-containing sensor histidine kinase [Clostridium sp. JS66]WPC43334.1 HAMP domain-containing sensor histidine kinase [Clostridium sp. JS66]
MFKKLSIRKSVMKLMVYIFAFSFVTTIIFEGIEGYILVSTSRNANYYESLVSKATKEIIKNQIELLDKDNFDIRILDKNLKGEVLQLNGNHISGDRLYEGGNLTSKLNISHINKNYGEKYIPLQNKTGEIKGVYYLRYPFGFSEVNVEYNIKNIILYVAMMITPFLVTLIYTLIFMRIFYTETKYKFDKFEDWVVKIKNNNFNFMVDDFGDTEFGRLAYHFNGMRMQLKESVEKNIRMGNQKQVMIASLAHDIRTPITVIKGYCEFLCEIADKRENNLLKYLEIIDENCGKIIFLLNNLIIISKMEGVGLVIKREPIDLWEWVNKKIMEFSIVAKSKNVKINLVYEEYKDKHEEYILDALLLDRVISNILHNSLRFTPNNGEINVRFKCEHDKIFFLFQDNGKGFDENIIEHHLDMFFTCDKNSSKGEHHFGLGIYIIKIIIEKNEGNVKFYNHENGGAVVEGFIKSCRVI